MCCIYEYEVSKRRQCLGKVQVHQSLPFHITFTVTGAGLVTHALLSSLDTVIRSRTTVYSDKKKSLS